MIIKSAVRNDFKYFSKVDDKLYFENTAEIYLICFCLSS